MNLKEVRLNGEIFPQVFYVGMGKTGSSSLFYGIKEPVAHWHDTEYFCRIHNNYSLVIEGINIYDFILDTCNEYGIEPIFIEAIRDPVAQRLSWYFQIFKNATAKQVIHAIQNDNWTFELNHFIEGMDDQIEPIVLRYEDIDIWQMQLALHGITYEPKHTNKRNNPEYEKAKEMLKINQEKLAYIYNQPVVNEYYSEQEVLNFIDRWTY